MIRRSAPVLARGLLLPLLPLLACTSAANKNPFPPPTTTGSGGGGVIRPPPSGDVTVKIDLPAASPIASFGAGSLVDVSAHVTVSGGSDFVDGTNVKVTVTPQGSSSIVDNGQLVLSTDASMPNVYLGRVSLGDLPSGTYTLTVIAGSSGGKSGMDSVDITVDQGPTVVVTSPAAGKSYKRNLTIEVVATDAFGLSGAPTATVGNIPVTLVDAGIPDTFRGVIDFDAQIPPLFDSQLLTVVATNVNGRRTEVQVIFLVDNDGPIIKSTHPLPGEIVGSIVEISAVVEDNAGVLDSSVIAVIGDDTSTPLFEILLKPKGGGVYSALFDSKQLTDCKDPPDTSLCIVFPTVSFRASDLLDNETSVGYAFAVDNVAPVADLDPPNLRDTKIDGELRCSWSFDPLGVDQFVGDMPNDKTMVPQVFDLRARIEDDGNRAEGLKNVPIAGVSADTTSVYILDDETQPLIVDTDGNGTCDSINPLLVPTTQPPTDNNQVLKVRLAPVPPAGHADFTPDPSIPPTQTSPCARGADLQPPLPLCTFDQPTLVISYAFGTPAIWAVEPIDKHWCSGGQFDTRANNIHEGWACIAVGTTDKAGNFSVSSPLRVYIQYQGVTGFATAPPASAGPPPACTGVYDRTTNTVTRGACTTRTLPGGYCYLGDC